jgi:5-methylcytosine-specific restriction endonuclease McrA
MSKQLTTTERKRLHSPHQPVGRWIREGKRLAIYNRDGRKCLCCNKALSVTTGEATLDHIIPRSAGGSNHETNLYTACGPCNSARGATPLEEFASFAAVRRIEAAIARALDVAKANLQLFARKNRRKRR